MLSRLMTLNLAANSLPSVPNPVSSLSRLCNLSLEQNNIAALPPFLSRLVSLRVSMCCLARTNAESQSLHVHHNSVASLDSCLRNLDHLEELNLGWNKLRRLPPDAFVDLTGLENLDVSWVLLQS
jgi:Leucine-rich repeat (LRR) protein